MADSASCSWTLTGMFGGALSPTTPTVYVYHSVCLHHTHEYCALIGCQLTVQSRYQRVQVICSKTLKTSLRTPGNPLPPAQGPLPPPQGPLQPPQGPHLALISTPIQGPLKSNQGLQQHPIFKDLYDLFKVLWKHTAPKQDAQGSLKPHLQGPLYQAQGHQQNL